MADGADENPEFDHLLHWVPDVPTAVAGYRAAGLPAHVNDELDGFQNGGWRLDERYVEILTITDERRLRTSRYAEGIEHLRPAMAAVGGDRGVLTFAVNVSDAHATANRLRAQGFELAEFAVTLAEHGVSFVEMFVRNAPVWTPFFITYTPPSRAARRHRPVGVREWTVRPRRTRRGDG
ncbi:VOC family protein [Prauserella cavernicola]|uniref:VOC family protein n=1 Tax=Prauserella cavernicola TaxID=2800127 RepID=A0A934R0D1_9PSEU|nr:VOC family protein [Prauserella cavernicola]MBK1789377.1 VOC family protein [Prauserella cavernicola]